MRISPEFPDYRYKDELRQSELHVYEEIETSPHPGQALYEVSATADTPQVDFVVWVQDVACFAIEVKGGAHNVQNGTLFRHTPEGRKQVPNPLRRALDGALSVRNAIASQLRSNCFVISVLLFPDMEPDAEIETWADTSRTVVMFGVDNLVERLVQLDEVRTVHQPPTAQRIDQEAAVFTQERVTEINRVSRFQGLPTALQAQHVEIHSLTINLFGCPPLEPSVHQEPVPSGPSGTDDESDESCSLPTRGPLR